MSDKQDRPQTRPSRKLVAILFADIVGYTSMMQADEATASAALKKFRQTLTNSVARYEGRIGNFYGDGCLAVFDSAVSAVRCAEQVQLIFQTEPKVPVRIGLHSGDVIFEEGNVYGDSINLASRIEAMGEAGAVLFSKPIYGNIKNQNHFQIESLGAVEFKNVNHPLDIYALANPGLIVPAIKIAVAPAPQKPTPTLHPLWSGPFKWVALLAVFFGVVFLAAALSRKQANPVVGSVADQHKSIAVLPFSNFQNDPDQDYFSEGIADDIRSQLAAIRDLKVISRASSMYYKNKSLPLSQIAADLGVQYILGGTVQKMGERVKINIELNDAPQNQIAWVSPAYNEKVKDIFFLQAEIAAKIVEALKVELSAEDKARMLSPTTVDPEIYAMELQAKNQLFFFTPTGLENAFQMAQEILALDSLNANAHLLLGNYYLIDGLWAGNLSPQAAMEKIQPHLDIVKAQDPNKAELPALRGHAKLFFQWDFEGAERDLQRGLELGEAWGASGLTLLNLLEGRYKEAMSMAKILAELDPLNFNFLALTGLSEFFSGNEEEAFRSFHKGLQLTNHIEYYKDLGKLYLNSGDYPQAIQMLEKGMDTLNMRPPAMLGDLAIALHKNGQKKEAQMIREELIQLWENKAAGSPSFFVGQIYSALGDKEMAFEWLEKSFAIHDVEMIWLKSEPQLQNLHGDPRYQDLITRVGFPVPLRD